jgi:uncharacterized membrane protein YeaQ/YmgE (transglycosylase-associated protein family)
MSFLWYVIIGAVAGWLAGLLLKGGGMGFLWNLLTGICGGVLGGWLAKELKIDLKISNPLVHQLVIATAGSVILLFLVTNMRKKS